MLTFTFKFVMQLAIISNQHKNIMKWGEVARWKEVDRIDAWNSFISIYLFFGHVT